MTKGILSSRTMWVAILIFGASMLSVFGVYELPTGEAAAWIGVAIGVIQAALRFITKKEIVIE